MNRELINRVQSMLDDAQPNSVATLWVDDVRELLTVADAADKWAATVNEHWMKQVDDLLDIHPGAQPSEDN